jgi:hypothetical protein
MIQTPPAGEGYGKNEILLPVLLHTPGSLSKLSPTRLLIGLKVQRTDGENYN